jgi:hypothetical protein
LSHAKERTEQDCLNCGAIVGGRFCQQCGQENIELKESFWDLIVHFFNDITHFHGKFFSTVWLLLSRPGFLSKEYIQGRRARYLHPIRLYVFTSAFFFIIFFTLFSAHDIGENSKKAKEAEVARIQVAINNLQQQAVGHADPTVSQTAKSVISQLEKEQLQLKSALAEKRSTDTTKRRGEGGDSTKPAIELKESKAGKSGIQFSDEGVETFDVKNVGYKSVLAYQRMQQALPASHRDGWIRKQFTYQVMKAVESGNADEQQYLKTMVDYLLHSFPKMLFITLPFFALLLKALYSRRKDLYYADHAIYAIHLFCATFLLTLFFFLFDKAQDWTGWGVFSFLQFVLVMGMFYYQFKSMRVFYEQGFFKTAIKFSILNMLAFSLTILLLLFFLAWSAVQASNIH